MEMEELQIKQVPDSFNLKNNPFFSHQLHFGIYEFPDSIEKFMKSENPINFHISRTHFHNLILFFRYYNIFL